MRIHITSYIIYASSKLIKVNYSLHNYKLYIAKQLYVHVQIPINAMVKSCGIACLSIAASCKPIYKHNSHNTNIKYSYVRIYTQIYRAIAIGIANTGLCSSIT